MNNKGFEKISAAIKQVEGSPEVHPNPGETRHIRFLTIGGAFGVSPDTMCNVLDVNGLMHHDSDPIVRDDDTPSLVHRNSDAGVHFFEDTASGPTSS